MYLFIAIIFIAELIIAATIISNINKADRFVCRISEKVSLSRPQTQKALLCFKECVICVQNSFEAATGFLKKKQHEFKMRIIKAIIIYALLIIMKSRFKKLATICQYLVFTKDCWDGLLV